MPKKDERSGFTLIEVVIAVVILASVIGTGSAMYHQYVTALYKSSRVISSCREIERLMPLIKERLKAGEKSGAGPLPLIKAHYKWTAESIFTGQNLMVGRNEQGGDIIGGFKLNIYNVSIDIEDGAEGDRRQVIKQEYRELTWRKSSSMPDVKLQ